MLRPVIVSLFVALLAGVGCTGPFGLMSGGPLEGEVKPVPADWGFLGDAGPTQLETNAGEPYSVNLAYTILDGTVYLNAGDTETQWVKNMDQNPEVRMRLGEALYELRAERVTDRGEIERFAKAWTDQSFFRRDPAELEQVWVYRMVAR